MAASSPVVNAQGVAIPALGFGTWQLTGEACVESVRDALELGYRHLDTARAYDNEAEVGRGLAESGLAREEVFITTKVWMDDAAAGAVRRSAEASLLALGVEHLDLLLLHWPNAEVPVEQTIEALAELRDLGLIRALGVSNFPPGLLRRALAAGPVATDQVEFHPFLGQDELLAIAAEHDLCVTAYAPLAHGKVLHDPTLQALADAHGSGPGQVALRWLLDQERVVAVPKASTHANRVANLEALDLELSPAERGRIDALPKDRRDFDPPWAPDWDA